MVDPADHIEVPGHVSECAHIDVKCLPFRNCNKNHDCKGQQTAIQMTLDI
jgi:hypothetical protein